MIASRDSSIRKSIRPVSGRLRVRFPFSAPTCPCSSMERVRGYEPRDACSTHAGDATRRYRLTEGRETFNLVMEGSIPPTATKR
jgi:hypothetical protein